jgi:hypothetical protein
MKLRNSPSDRWAATKDVFIRLLRCWNPIRNSFLEEELPFAIVHDKQLLVELYSLIHPVRFIQSVTQRTKELAVLQVYVLMMEAFFGALDKKSPLNVYNPAAKVTISERSNATSKGNNHLDQLVPTSVIPGNELDPQTIRVRKMLCAAMYNCFFKRYHPKDAYKGRIPLVAAK